MKRLCAILLCIGLSLGILSGCAEKEQEPYTPTGDGLTWDEDYTGPTAPPKEEEPQKLSLIWYPDRTLNPYTCADFTNQMLFSLLYQSLFSVDRSYSVEPVLCQNYAMSEDMTTYTFYPTAATFSDGTWLTPEDIAASLQAAKDGPVYGGRLRRVVSIEVTEDRGVKVVMNTAYENLPILLDIPIVKAAEVAMDTPLGTGPYKLEGGGSGALLRKRTDWWCKATLPISADTISMVVAESVTQIRDSFEFRGLSMVCADPGSDRYADYRCDYELWDSENGVFLYMACNMNSEVFSKPELRAALTGVVDRDTIAAEFYRGFGRPATLPASPMSPYYNNTLASRYGYDGGAALKEALLTAELPADTVVKFLVNKDDSLRNRVARTIAESLRQCGLTVELLSLSTSEYENYLKNGWYDLYLGHTRLSPNMDLSAFFSETGALSYGSLDNSALYSLCNESLANHGNFYTLHQSVMDDGRLCPILFGSYAIYATRGLLTWLNPSRSSIFYYSLGRTMENALIQ